MGGLYQSPDEQDARVIPICCSRVTLLPCGLVPNLDSSMPRRNTPLLLIAGILNAACGGTGAPYEHAGPTEYPVLIGRFADEDVRQPLQVRDAFIGEEQFYVSYVGPDGLVHAGGNWSDRIDIRALTESDDDSYAGPYILPLQYQQREPWADLPFDPIRPRLLSAEQWGRFRDRLFEAVMPEDRKAGLVMHFDADDYFLYHNELGNFESRLITDKPGDYRVAKRIEFEEFIRRGLPELEAFLEAEGVAERRIVFETGDAGAYSLPFLYVDLDLPIAVFVRYAQARRASDGRESSPRLAQSMGHVAHSHLGAMAVRPVSSVYRLLFAATDVAVETVRPTPLAALDSAPIPELSDGPGMDLAEWERQLDRLTGRDATTGTIDYLIDGEEYFTRLIDAITSANDSVHIRTYIFDNDDYAETIGNLLKRRSQEGIDVKILLDGLGTILATGAEDETMPEDYVPPPSVREFLEADSEVDVRQARNPWLAGDHVKTTIIDDTIAFLGGMNIGREYRYTWHDLMVEARGPVVGVLREEFDGAWAHAGPLGDISYVFQRAKPERRLAREGGYPVRVLFTRTGNAEIFRAQRAAIRNAKGYIFIENAYFTDDAMLFELAKARRRGVDVRVILPLVGNHGPINKSNALAANAMLEHGIRVFLYPGMSHVKAAVFDGWACFGSANWDKLSFRINKELNLATSHPSAVDAVLERLFEADFAESVELSEPFPASWSDHLYELLADYML